MIVETLSAVVLSVLLSWAGLRSLPGRLPARRTVFGTGAAGAVFGASLMHSVLGDGHAALAVVGAGLIAAVTVSLLIRPRGRRISRSAAV
ncbi:MULTISPECIES: hypothetical protein [unclassified Streptomyces]|uniref:hypothetical protein n=1 Tax=unclassified Streptomyces TaxID=2593676 RepID=UPI000DADA4B7|nr:MULTISPECIES: hypothetical protein [unclassified Streptomyces]PZT76510.1 hypothetical protein DNK56_24610 [Streptomyces sp. AC1-42W]PZT79533.1 hypothetical protein DNK55_08055 [Streptomyces sp. AC1-42T]WUC95843.1 hypothetical protein OG710_20555 [Streptomyces sp. NBC_00525]